VKVDGLGSIDKAIRHLFYGLLPGEIPELAGNNQLKRAILQICLLGAYAGMACMLAFDKIYSLAAPQSHSGNWD
jgi:hypothetical protein